MVIELDGSQHFMEAGEAYDQRRTAYMERFGIQLRFMPNLSDKVYIFKENGTKSAQKTSQKY